MHFYFPSEHGMNTVWLLKKLADVQLQLSKFSKPANWHMTPWSYIKRQGHGFTYCAFEILTNRG